MDPTCPLYGKEPLPLPKSMADLFPVRDSPSDDFEPLIVVMKDKAKLFSCYRSGSTRKRPEGFGSDLK